MALQSFKETGKSPCLADCKVIIKTSRHFIKGKSQNEKNMLKMFQFSFPNALYLSALLLFMIKVQLKPAKYRRVVAKSI